MASVWVDETDLRLKMYDVMSVDKDEDGACQRIANETFTIAQETATIRNLYTPKLRLKRVACVDDAGKVAAIKLALEYNRDHRDSIHFTKMPRGFKIIGIRGWRYTNGGQMLHLNDFLIWKPPPGWLSVKELARRLEPQGANAGLNSRSR